MANYNAAYGLPFVTGEDLSAGIYKLAAINSSGQVIVNTTAGSRVAGIIAMNAATSAVGLHVPVIMPSGCKAKVMFGATLVPGNFVMAHTNGRVILYVDAADNQCLGIVTEGAGDGEIGSIIFAHMGTGGS